MDDYREYVRTIAAVADGKEIIQNKTPAHAGVLIAALFDKAEQEVLIVSGSLDGRAYGTDEAVVAASNFLSRNDAQLSIVIEQPVTFAENRFLSLLRDLQLIGTNRVILRRTPQRAPFHFLLADGKHFRFEADPTKHEAIAQFGAPSIELRNAFNLILGQSAAYTPA